MKEQFNTALEQLIEKLKGWFTTLIENIPNFIIAILVMIAAYYASKYVSKLMGKILGKKIEQESIKSAISKVTAVIVVALGLFIALGILNLGKALTSLLAGAGVVGLAIGLALQGTLANTFAGLVLSFRKNIRIGNWVETNDFSGVVTEINLKNFAIRESDNNIVLIPNKTILDSPLKNYSLTDTIRVTVECGVGYESDLEKVEALTKETIANTFNEVPDKEVEFYFKEFGDSSINFFCRFWIKGRKRVDEHVARNKAVIAIKKAFDNEDINIPFPIRTLQFGNNLNVKSPDMQKAEG